MNYLQRLKDPRWQEKRLRVMDRDKFTCIRCTSNRETLHVHHVKYDDNPWDTIDKFLQTLCHECHKDLGVHPKGGIGWESDSPGAPATTFMVIHCPICAGTEWKDKGSYDKCKNCGWASRPDRWI